LTIAIVGAGPVGLWTAIQIKLRNPQKEIVVFEQYVEYKRKHVIKLQYASLLLYACLTNYGFVSLLIKELLGISFGKILNEPLKSQFISTQTIESLFKELAIFLKIDVQYKKICSFDHLKRLCPDMGIAIFADGARSTLRAEVFGGQHLDRKDLQYVVEVKYQLNSKKISIAPLSKRVLEKAKLNFMAFEYIGKPKEDVHPVTLRFFVDQETYESMPVNNHGSPLDLHSTGLPEKLKGDIKTLMIFLENANDGSSSGVPAITTLILSVYAAKSFSTMHEGTPCYLVGDAAMGVPYFRALNSGLLLGSRLARFITRKRMPWLTKNSTEKAMRAYEKYRAIHVTSEIATAMTKDWMLRLYSHVRQIPAWVSLLVHRG
jgi:hypothetical protein